MPSRFDPKAATEVFHYRNPALDEPWGEGRDLTLWRTAEGRFYRRDTYTHIDADGPHTTEGFVSDEVAAESLANYERFDLLKQLIPSAWQVQTWEAYELASTYDLADDEAFIGDCVKVCELETGPVLRHRADLYVHDRVGADGRPWRTVAAPHEAAKKLARWGAPRAVLELCVPSAPETRLIQAAGAETWAELQGAAGAALWPRCEELRRSNHDVGMDGMICGVVHFRINDDLFVRHYERKNEPTELEAMGAADALIDLATYPEMSPEALRRIFPSVEVWRAVSERASLPDPFEAALVQALEEGPSGGGEA